MRFQFYSQVRINNLLDFIIIHFGKHVAVASEGSMSMQIKPLCPQEIEFSSSGGLVLLQGVISSPYWVLKVI